jgi:hypothetical protein
MWSLLRNLLAVIGLAALIFAGSLRSRPGRDIATGSGRDGDLLQARRSVSGDPGSGDHDGQDHRRRGGSLAEGCRGLLKSLAVQHNILFVGEAPFYKQVEAVTGKPYRFVSFYSFCDANVGVKMLEYNTAYSAFMPCRISLVEDDEGRLWLHMMDLDMFIHGGKPLPADVKAGAIHVRDSLEKILAGAASGEF